MSFEEYKGKTVTIKSTDKEGTILNARHKRGADNSLGARFTVVTADGKEHELMPHEIKIHEGN
jgi:hypothetical protein